MQAVHSSIETHAINTVNMLLITQCEAVTMHSENYMLHIIGIFNALNSAGDVLLRQRIVEGISTLLAF